MKAEDALVSSEATRASVPCAPDGAGAAGVATGVTASPELRQTVSCVCEQMKTEVERAGVTWSAAPTYEAAKFTSQVDPFDQSRTIMAKWEEGRETQGTLQVREDGNVFGEYFVTLPHPRRRGRFIEAVLVWGKVGALRSELRLVEE